MTFPLGNVATGRSDCFVQRQSVNGLGANAMRARGGILEL